MPNHLHLLVQQGNAPLARLMQPLLRRVALLIQHTHGIEGHVFERRFRDKPCPDADYARNAIAYIHRNAMEAGLSEDALRYRWTSHALYAGQISNSAPALRVHLTTAIELFGESDGRSRAQLHADYLEYYDWAAAAARAKREGRPPPEKPATAGGDAFWAQRYAAAVARAAPALHVRSRQDLRDMALQVIREFAPNLDLEALQSRSRIPRIVAVRQELICRATIAGYRGTAIASFLNMSESRVSEVASCRFRIPAKVRSS